MEDADLNLKPLALLGGYTAADYWISLNLVLLTWVLMMFQPQWKWTPTLTLVTPMFHSFLYAGALFSLMFFSEDPPTMDFGSLDGVVRTFQDPNVVFVGWVHYIAFDALVGRMILLDSLRCQVSLAFHIFGVIPCLLLCFFFGPVGFFLYMLLRKIFNHHHCPPTNGRDQQEYEIVAGSIGM